MILSNPGQRAVVQHAKLNGQLIFGTLPYPCGFENKCRGGDLDMFDLAYYPPRCQLCIPYGVCTDEPLPISRIGRGQRGTSGGRHQKLAEAGQHHDHCGRSGIRRDIYGLESCD